jgi:O-antigen/teichoic acid export membrane protein
VKVLISRPFPHLLVRLREKTRNPQSIFHMALIVLKTNVCLQVLMGAGSIILIRSVPKEDYGLWRVMASTTAFIPLLLGGLDDAIHRFVPTETKQNRDVVAFAVLATKTLVTVCGIAILVGLLPWLRLWLNVPNEMRWEFMWLFWAAIGSVALTPLVSNLYAVASAHKQFDLIFRISVAKQIAAFLCVLGVAASGLSLVYYAFCELVLNVAQVVALWRTSRAEVSAKGGDVWRAFADPGRWALLKQGWRLYLVPFAAPLNVASALSYVRGHLPVILLGSQFSLQSAAIYAILKNLLTAIHKMEGGIVGGVMPRIFELFETNREGFLRKFGRWTAVTYSTRFAIGVAILVGSPLLFRLYKIESSAYLTVVLVILVLEFLMTGIINVSNMVVRMSGRTTTLMVSAVVRFVFEVVLLWFVTRRYGILGAAITLFLARTVETMATVTAANRIVRMRQQPVMCALVLGAFAVILGIVWSSAIQPS